MTVARRFKGYFLHGLAVLLPSILTIWLFVWGYTFLQHNISRHINRGLVYIIALVDHNDVKISKAEVRTYLLDVKKPELKGQSEELIETHLNRDDLWQDAKINKKENQVQDYLKPDLLVRCLPALSAGKSGKRQSNL